MIDDGEDLAAESLEPEPIKFFKFFKFVKFFKFFKFGFALVSLHSWLLVAIAMHDAWVCIAWRLEGICSFVLQLQLNFIKESTTSYLYMYGTHRLKLHFG